MENVKFCKSCVISNQRPSSTAEFKNDGKAAKQAIQINSSGICDACRVKEEKAAKTFFLKKFVFPLKKRHAFIKKRR